MMDWKRRDHEPYASIDNAIPSMFIPCVLDESVSVQLRVRAIEGIILGGALAKARTRSVKTK